MNQHKKNVYADVIETSVVPYSAVQYNTAQCSAVQALKQNSFPKTLPGKKV